MKKIALTVALSGLIYSASTQSSAHAEKPLLSEMFGRGIHAYYIGNHDDAREMFSSAIENGLADPRVFYFRGIVAFEKGNNDQAVADWKTGADLEANSRSNYSIGRSLSRFQGKGRVQLEGIRQTARLSALQARIKRAQQRYGELANGNKPVPHPVSGIVPPPVPSDIVNPFAADIAGGSASVVDNDALKNAMNDPFAGEATTAPANAAPATNNDPFSGDNNAGGNDPFGGSADPFGGNPFGN